MATPIAAAGKINTSKMGKVHEKFHSFLSGCKLFEVGGGGGGGGGANNHEGAGGG